MKIKTKWKWLWGVILLFAWSTVLLVFLKSNGNLSVNSILNYKPENTGLAILSMLGLFLLKSVDFLMHSGVLYAADGIMFPLPAAVMINLIGAAIMITPTYFIGRTLGEPVLAWIVDRHPKIQMIAKISEKGEFALSIVMRMIGLPLLPVGLYLGAVKCRFTNYLFGSLIGLFPLLLTYTIIGTSAGDVSSPVFWYALGINVFICILTSIGTAVAFRKKRNHSEDVKK